MREAIAFARKARDGELLLRLATALWGFWSSRVYGAEGRRALEDALELSGRRPARTLLGLCTLRMLSGSSEQLTRGRPGGARGVPAAGRRLQPCASLEPGRAGRGNRDGLARDRRGRLEAGPLFARRGNYRAELAESISWLMVSAVFGPLPAEEGIARCREFLALEGDDPTIRATCSVERAVLEAMRGDLASARELLAEGRRTIEESGLTLWAALNAQETYLVEQLAGTPGAAVRLCARASRRWTGAASAPTSRRSPAFSPTRSTPRGRTSRRNASAARASGPPRRRRALTGALADGAREDPRAARRAREGRGTRPRGRRARRADRPARNPQPTRWSTSPRCSRRRPPRRIAGCARRRSGALRTKGERDRPCAGSPRAGELG